MAFCVTLATTTGTAACGGAAACCLAQPGREAARDQERNRSAYPRPAPGHAAPGYAAPGQAALDHGHIATLTHVHLCELTVRYRQLAPAIILLVRRDSQSHPVSHRSGLPIRADNPSSARNRASAPKPAESGVSLSRQARAAALLPEPAPVASALSLAGPAPAVKPLEKFNGSRNESPRAPVPAARCS